MLFIDRESKRQLVSVEVIEDIKSIEGADKIVQAKVRGWNVVIGNGEFNIADHVLFFETDTLLPLSDERFSFLESRGVIEIDGEKYHKIKTACLRGAYSQGLVLPIEQFNDIINIENITIGKDLTKEFNVGIEGNVYSDKNIIGDFPTQYIDSTNIERIQNISKENWKNLFKMKWIATEKVDGTPLTIFKDDKGNLRIATKDKEVDINTNNYLVREILDNYSSLYAELNSNEAIQLEIVGPKVEENKLQLKERIPFVFKFSRNNIPINRKEWSKELLKYSVPIHEDIVLDESIDNTIDMVNNLKSKIDKKLLAEGIVFHTEDNSKPRELKYKNSFKVINNKYLLKKG